MTSKHKTFLGRDDISNHDLWRRSKEEEYEMDFIILENSFKATFDQLDVNAYVNYDTKDAALQVSPSLVSLISYHGKKKFFWASGFVIESETVNSSSTILTSASVLGLDTFALNEIKVEVITRDGHRCWGDVIAFERQFNVCAIKIGVVLPKANLNCFDDRIEESLDFVALGRYHKDTFEMMVAPGELSFYHCGFDCDELLRVDCKITKCGIGGPMINLYGEVVGINFYSEHFTPFLPINVISTWWKHVKGGRPEEYNRAWLGVKVCPLYAANADDLAVVMRTFPDILKGIIVKNVTKGSPAAVAGLRPKDLIVQLAGTMSRTAWSYLKSLRTI